MKRYISIIRFSLSLLVLVNFSCNKEWLDEKPSKSLIVPTTIKDFQALLDNNFNATSFNNGQPILGEIGSDNYYITQVGWNNLSSNTQKNAYLWEKDIYKGDPSPDWSTPYTQIFYSNVVLEGINKILETSANRIERNNIHGSALFSRAFAYYNLSQIFAAPYDKNDAQVGHGLPLHLKSDVNDNPMRSSVHETYAQIIKDLTEAVELLPVSPAAKTRPSKPAAFALLAKVYLTMGDYQKAFSYSNSCLELYSNLMDYNLINAALAYPFEMLNAEDIYFSASSNQQILSNNGSNAIVDPVLYQSYNDNDLRKILFFKPSSLGTGFVFKGSYYGAFILYGGIAIDEVILIRGEANARIGNKDAAMQDLNTLLKKRYKSGTFADLIASSSEEALAIVLRERRKELIFRVGTRWTDLRRLNKEGANIVLTRVLNDKTYTLQPNDRRYTLPIPDQEIILSGIQQNER
jgi:tetratricopeptide (TPR) repeat protein